MAQRQLPVDFKEFVNFLNSNKVEYLLLGGWAVGIYGHPRAIPHKSNTLPQAVSDDRLRQQWIAISPDPMASFEQCGSVMERQALPA